jgi:hypothetical protein
MPSMGMLPGLHGFTDGFLDDGTDFLGLDETDMTDLLSSFS